MTATERARQNSCPSNWRITGTPAALVCLNVRTNDTFTGTDAEFSTYLATQGALVATLKSLSADVPAALQSGGGGGGGGLNGIVWRTESSGPARDAFCFDPPLSHYLTINYVMPLIDPEEVVAVTMCHRDRGQILGVVDPSLYTLHFLDIPVQLTKSGGIATVTFQSPVAPELLNQFVYYSVATKATPMTDAEKAWVNAIGYAWVSTDFDTADVNGFTLTTVAELEDIPFSAGMYIPVRAILFQDTIQNLLGITDQIYFQIHR